MFSSSSKNKRRTDTDNSPAVDSDFDADEYELLLAGPSSSPDAPTHSPHRPYSAHEPWHRRPWRLLRRFVHLLTMPHPALSPRRMRSILMPFAASIHVNRALIALLLIVLTSPLFVLMIVLAYGGVPPSYADVREAERRLPQHAWGAGPVAGARQVKSRIADGKGEDKEEEGPKYLRFPDHLWGHGLNNILQEAILAHHLTTQMNRTPVFEDYVWSHLPLPYTLYDFALRPTRVPMGAYLGGVLVGGGRARGDPLPLSRRAISAEYFEHVCPPSERVEVVYAWPSPVETPSSDSSASRSSDIPSSTSASATTPLLPPLSPAPQDNAPGEDIIAWFVERLQRPDVREKPCVVVREERRRVWDWSFFGSTRILALFPTLRTSPVLAGFDWSPLVHGALERTMRQLFGVHANNGEQEQDSTSALPSSTIPNLLAIHLRRGDYERHCTRLAQWGSGYMGFNRFEGLVDVFDVEGFLANATATSTRRKGGAEVGGKGDDEENEDARKAALQARKEAYYLAHCLPSVEQIVQRLRVVREEYQDGSGLTNQTHTQRGKELHRLNKIYVLTNGWPSFVEELRDGLVRDGWEAVFGTPDLDGLLSREEKGVSVAVDMALAERAEVFVGNGFSSLSANIVMLRMAKGFPVYSNRLL